LAKNPNGFWKTRCQRTNVNLIQKQKVIRIAT
jgi:hypothetical protein